MNKIFLKLEHVYKFFGNRCVLYDINLETVAGQIVGLVGPTGCGKSTLLKAILGTQPPTRGRVLVYSKSRNAMKEITGPNRDIGIVYQDYKLPPFLRAIENVALGLKLDETTIPRRLFGFVPHFNKKRKIDISWFKLRKVHLEEAAEWLTKLKLGDALYKYPHELSGGMRQRVAIAQALIMKPKVLLLDEPFGALDEATRKELQEMLLELYQENIEAVKNNKTPPYTILIVTHELKEAILVGDRVLGLSKYWNYKNEHDPCAKDASTIVYDKASPVFLPNQDRDYGIFAAQRDEIYEVVIDSTVLQDRGPYITFWNQVKDGSCKQGVLKSPDLQDNLPKENLGGNKNG